MKEPDTFIYYTLGNGSHLNLFGKIIAAIPVIIILTVYLTCTFLFEKKKETTISDKDPLVPYADLALGAKFKFVINGERSVTWVKLSHDGKIAKWNQKLQSKRWYGQIIASTDLTDKDTRFVEVLE